MQTTTGDESSARFDREADDRSSLRKILDRYNVSFAWGVGVSYVFYLVALVVMPPLIVEKLLGGSVAAVGLLTVVTSAVLHRRK